MKVKNEDNRLKITILEEMAKDLAIKEGDKLDVFTEKNKRIIRVNKMKFYGVLNEGIKEWPKPEEIKSIWE
jgi:ABC-type lipoprotein release transport system permease subunit